MAHPLRPIRWRPARPACIRGPTGSRGGIGPLALLALATLWGCSALHSAADATQEAADLAPASPPDAAVDAMPPDAGPVDAALPITVPAEARARPLDPRALARWRTALGGGLAAAGATGWGAVIAIGETVIETYAVGQPQAPAVGPLTPKTLRPLGTVTRVVTGLLIAALIEEGHLEWSAPATRLRRDWATGGPDPTLAEMACGCSGDAAVPGTPPATPSQVLDGLKRHLAAGDALEAMPTQLLAAAAGYLAASAAPGASIDPGAAYVAQVAERVALPLGLTLTIGAPDAPGIVPVYAPDHGAWASLDDLGRLLAALLAEGLTSSGGRIVERGAIEQLRAPIEGPAGPAIRLGLRIEDRGALRLERGGGPAGHGITRLMLAGDLGWAVRVEGQGPAVEAALDRALDGLIALRYGLPPPGQAAPADRAPAPGMDPRPVNAAPPVAAPGPSIGIPPDSEASTR